jgi:hypothetical protein
MFCSTRFWRTIAFPIERAAERLRDNLRTRLNEEGETDTLH